MYFLVRVVLLFTAASLILSESCAAAVVFQPGKKAKFVAPGEEEISETALELFQTAQTAEKQGNLKRAIHAFKSIVRQHPKDALAAGALYRAAELQEQLHEYLGAADSFRQVVERYPSSPHFDEAIEAQFRIGEIYLAGKKKKLLGIPVGSSLERAVTIFANVVRTAPYGKYTARAQFNIGLAREKQHVPEMAIEAYQAVVDKFPNEPVAADAQYQIGYIWLMAAKKRIDQLRKKVGETALQPAFTPGEAGKKKATAHGARMTRGESAKPSAPNNEAPLPAPDIDTSLPPPASLTPDTTTAPEPSST